MRKKLGYVFHITFYIDKLIFRILTNFANLLGGKEEELNLNPKYSYFFWLCYLKSDFKIKAIFTTSTFSWLLIKLQGC